MLLQCRGPESAVEFLPTAETDPSKRNIYAKITHLDFASVWQSYLQQYFMFDPVMVMLQIFKILHIIQFNCKIV